MESSLSPRLSTLILKESTRFSLKIEEELLSSILPLKRMPLLLRELRFKKIIKLRLSRLSETSLSRKARKLHLIKLPRKQPSKTRTDKLLYLFYFYNDCFDSHVVFE
jgi:hypothetical protein